MKEYSSERYRKIAEKLKGRKILWKDKISEALKGNQNSKGFPRNKEWIEKIVEKNKGYKHSDEIKIKISEARKGKCLGEKNPRWVKDRNSLKIDRLQAYDSKYQEWMKAVKNRDNWKCKINNQDCQGKLEAHHILPWSNFPELRYEINNGISLCHFHHPRKKNDEIKLAPIFQELVLVTDK